AAAGLLVGIGTLRLLLRLPAFAQSGFAIDAAPGLRVLGFTMGVAVLSGLLFSLVPALHASRPRLVPALKDGTPGAGAGRSRARSILVVGQLALSLVLLVGAGLFVRTLQALYAVEPGFETEQVLVATLDL